MDFDRQLASECAESFSLCSGLGCLLTDTDGEVLYSCGKSCSVCNVCALAGQDVSSCRSTLKYGLHESERFGGKYIYFCSMGLACVTSPVMGENGAEAQITAGPFLMVDPQDYASYELAEVHHLDSEKVETIMQSVSMLPYVDSDRVKAISQLLFMAASFLNSVSGVQRMMDLRKSDSIQRQISDYIYGLKKTSNNIPPYPYHLEHRFLQTLSQGEESHTQANKLLNELLGHIMFSSAGDLNVIRSRIYELLILISRIAAERGGDQNMISCRLQEFQQQIFTFDSIDDLCLWLSGSVRSFMDLFYSDRNARYKDLIHRIIQYLDTHYAEKITLEDVAHSVYLSPTYLSHTFVRETGVSMFAFLNRIRIEKSKELLAQKDMNMLQVAFRCGFESQSYFSSVFKEICGITPHQYRSGCR